MEPRNYQSGAAGSAPTPEASPSTGYPTDGDPATAVPATVPGAAWFHQVGAELRNLIVQAGITPDDTDLTQVYAAVAALIAAGGTLPLNYLAGFGLSNNAADAAKDIDIAVGVCRDSSNTKDMQLTSSFTKQLDASWAVGSAAGGLSSSLSLVANTWYHVFAVEISGVIDVLVDTSVTCANGIADHNVTKYRRLGSVLTDASVNIIPFIQTGSEFRFKTSIQDVNVIDSTTMAALRTLSAPLGVKTDVIFSVYQYKNATTTMHIFSSPFVDDIAPSVITSTAWLFGYSTPEGQGVGVYNVITNLSSQIRTRSSQTGSTLKITTLGWRDISLGEGL